MAKNLVIVESPAKAKTISGYLGKDFDVKSSFGHIRDLPKSGMNVDIEGGTFEPTYEVNSDKKKVVAELKRAAKTADTVWLAADEDREGEAIAWHVVAALNLPKEKTRRIVFHEITKPAILKAVENPRELNIDLVNAQQARRVLDRVVGYTLSPVLWRKIKTGLSAGRVQSVAVRVVVEREREIMAFDSKSQFRVQAVFILKDGTELAAELPKKFKDYDSARKFLEECKDAVFKIVDLAVKPGKKSPAAPFTTSTLQQEASRKLGFSVKQTMSVAQKLYESGKITYMRTDSMNLSDLALGQAGNVIDSRFGKKYHQVRKYKTKSAGAQEAHEAIRPTDLSKDSVGGDTQQARLYDLIWKRTIASQMADAQIERTTATIEVKPGLKQQFVAKGEVVKFDGFLGVYIEGTDDEDTEKGKEKMLPPLTVGETMEMKEIISRETFTRPPARYTEASLVRALEEKGIGRPSTYAPTISTIQARGYIEKGNREGREREYRVMTLPAQDKDIVDTKKTEKTGSDKNKLLPTDIGMAVNDFLVKQFSDVVDYDFTKKVEEEFDEVAQGKKVWNTMIKDFYTDFVKEVDVSKDVSREEVMQVRELGDHPKTGKPIYARLGRFGPMVQMGHKDDEEKPTFASLQPGQTIDTITFDEAVTLLSLPRLVGKTPEGEEIQANFGRFGPYVKVGKLFVSIKPEDPFTITLEKSLELIAEKKKAEAEKYIHVWEEDDIQVLNGRYGPYIKAGKNNIKIPKGTDPQTLTLEAAKEIIANDPKSKRGAKKAPAKKTAAKKKPAAKKKTTAKKTTKKKDS